jgi:hypothetical protein
MARERHGRGDNTGDERVARDRRDSLKTGVCGSLAAGLLAAACLLAAGCGGPGGGPSLGDDDLEAGPAALWPDAEQGAGARRMGCDVLEAPARRGAALVVAVCDPVDPDHAPSPRTAGERLVFAQLYETLVRVDCAGNVTPGLADHWTCTSDSTGWIFALRPGARFWDGTPVTAGEIKAAWRRRDGAAPGDGELKADPWSWLDAGDNSIEVLDARRLKVQLPEPQADLPRLLAHPATAVAARREGWTWPVGSGPARLRASTPRPLPEIVCLPNSHHPDQPAWQQLVFEVRPGADLRDLAPAGFDLAVTRSLDEVRYFGEAPGYRTDPLPWDRLYLLVCPPEANTGGGARWAGAADRLDPVRDLTRMDARPWDAVVLPDGHRGRCPQLSGPVSFDPPLRRDSDLASTPLDAATIVYPEGDPGARELAGRLSAFAGPGVRTAPLCPASVQLALRWQMAGAVVLPLELQFPSSCLQMSALLSRAAWLQQAALDEGPPLPVDSLPAAHRAAESRPDPADVLRDRALVLPLAASRAWIVSTTAGGGLGGLVLDYDGTPRLAGLGLALAEEPAP